jgi:uncharacterized membrane protein YczE
MFKNINVKKVVMLFLGIVILGFGCTLLIISNIGTDSISIMYQGCSRFFGITIGLGTFLVTLLFTTLLFFLDRSKIGLATLVSISLLGPCINIFCAIPFVLPGTFLASLVFLIVGLLVCSFGVALYIKSDTGLSAYEGLDMYLSEKIGFSFGKVKIFVDCIFFIIGWVMGGTFGIGSVITLVFYGPLIDFFLTILGRISALQILKE